MEANGLRSFRTLSKELGARNIAIDADLSKAPRGCEGESPKDGWNGVWQRVIGEVSGAEGLLSSSLGCDRRSLLGGKGGSKPHVEVSEREDSDKISLSVRIDENVKEVVAALRGEARFGVRSNERGDWS